ncbi:hypothetical protein Hdeb2414_s0011g00359881 [Helianthus debilis subsp. tardiflorus]
MPRYRSVPQIPILLNLHLSSLPRTFKQLAPSPPPTQKRRSKITNSYPDVHIQATVSKQPARCTYDITKCTICIIYSISSKIPLNMTNTFLLCI